ncbi:MAG: hypothetical protein ACYTBJ_25840 [Planctomycetota bacterium]|jgi:uncharacterized membrane-anchored protein YhcB (DUF1043 family)
MLTIWEIVAIVGLCGVCAWGGWMARIDWEGLKMLRKRDAEYEQAKRRFEEQLERVSNNLRKSRGD